MSANGNLDPSTLTQVDGWALLETHTAHAWLNAAAEVLAVTGLRPIITPPIGAYRNYDQQVAIKAEFTAAGNGNQAAWPGTSNHGWGTAVDVYNISRFNQTQLDDLMRGHGFVRDVTFESWHYHHVTDVPGDDSAPAGTGTSIPTQPPIELGDPVATVYFKGDTSGAVFALNKDTGKKRNVSSSEFAVVNSASAGTLPNFGAMSGGGLIIVPQADADAITAE